jgi:flagellar basal body-associated protein FliL
MPEKTWLETRQKKTRWYVLFFVVAVIAGLAVFVRNNWEMFFPKSGGAKQEAVISLSDAPKVALRDSPKDEPASRHEKKRDMAGSDVKNAPEKTRATSSVMLPDIPCGLRDRGAFKVTLSLELIMADDSFEREILLKRENLKVMVQKVIANKTLDELVVESLRTETKTAMNAFLQKKIITDVEFRDFRIDKVK